MSPSPVLGRLVREMARQPGRLALVAAALVAASVARVGSALLVALWVEGPIARRDLSGAVPLAAVSLAVVAGLALLVGASRALVAAVDQALVEELRNRVVARLLAATLGASRRFRAGDLVSRVLADAGVVAGFAQMLLRDLLGDGLVAAGSVVLLVVLSPPLAVALGSAAAVSGLAAAVTGKAIRRRAGKARAGRGDLASLVEEQLRGLRTVKGFRTERLEEERFGAASGALACRVLSVERLAALQQAFVFVVTGAGALGVLLLGSREAAAGRLPIGTLLALGLLAAQVVEPVRRIGEAWGGLQSVLAAAQRLFEVLDLPGPAGEQRLVTAGPVPGGSLRIEDVRVVHAGGPAVLDGLELAVADGERVAVVAASGGGKSTLAALLWRLQAPLSGRLLLGGRDLSELPLGTVRRAVCVVEQEPFLFTGTLGENLVYGSPGVPAGALEEAVRLVGLEPVVASLPGGLEGRVGERGTALSGGERQRVALARAVLRDPRLLVLDEATQALDSAAEDALLARLEPWLAARTVLVMSHRLSTVQRVPRAVVLVGGRVVADGEPASLLATNGAMRALFGPGAEPEPPCVLPSPDP